MTSHNAFTVYNAAAGAGKTYTLVKEYLTTLLTGSFKESYKNILAITFTNKAVAEMKTRVLQNLVAISAPETPPKYESLLQDIMTDTGLDMLVIKKKANQVLKSILHNYAGFDIVTIDTFTHRIIRTFAHDLGIPMNFEIEMDTESLIEESVDSLLAKVGVDPELTKIIIDFALSKLEDDKSWDITTELIKIARLLFSENDREHLNKLSEKTGADFEELKKVIYDRIIATKNDIISNAKNILNEITAKDLEFRDFMRGSIPAHFKKLADGESNVDFKAAWKQNIGTTDFYNKTLDQTKRSAIDSIRSQIEEAFLLTKKQASQRKLLENIINNLTPLSVLNAINKELQNSKKERNILLISEFNKIISEAIQDQPAPFIYERLGERYRDYFIDEFQDTSELQWNNMIPLIDNAIATETLTGKRGKLTIVGDAKQAIYRWRGGKAEQFINLSLDENPFSVKEKQVLNLPKNYRSCEEIIKFNNNLFTFLSNDFSNELHKKLYLLGNNQEYNTKKGGYINLSFIEAKNIAEENEIYPERVFETIIELQKKGYKLNAICVLTRRQKEGTAIADFLTEKGVSIISSETLLLKNDPRVIFVINMLTWNAFPDNFLAKTNVLHFIAERFAIAEKHAFLTKMVFADKRTFWREIASLGVEFDFRRLGIKPFYDCVEYIINSFNLADSYPAYLQFFLDAVFGYTQKHAEGVIGFLSYWERKKDTLSIISPEGEEAIKIMTIHKSKGLEFPCVIYPYANIDIYREIEPKTWLPVSKEDFLDFEEAFINYNKEISDYGEEANKIVLQRQSQLELDALNLLYVVLTRAEEQLYIISKKEVTSKGISNPNKFSGKFINYLKHIGIWNDDQCTYDFGNIEKPDTESIIAESKTKKIELTTFDNASKIFKVQVVTNSGKLWDTAQKSAIEKGNLIHELMASIYTDEDLDSVIKNAIETGMISYAEKETLYAELKKLMDHPKLSTFFSKNYMILNEREIIANGNLYRPDRVVIDKSRGATIIDYKTGERMASHNTQLNQYGELIKKMGYLLENKILVYFNQEMSVEYVE
ncbi:exodeoxyribonuclease V subunit beta [Aquimarina sp. RZ0]|uniref:UvrD-helicase domain-containing protein n=1 Tax=Aquimarina sp. RZ0 TaxID=2607730 RepID=UPI0011F4014A|nr:UvrD-helicase domain-containing protein [Aquimarina sp. RZ0]KAA1246296.1 AAA family ATPase [Aquimarina sp. RZ0]